MIKKKVRERQKRLSEDGFYEKNLQRSNIPPKRLLEQLRFINDDSGIVAKDDIHITSSDDSFNKNTKPN